ncbi:MAG: hypothetical protein Q7V11_14995, partial [Pseudotabrizicola sp.]|nr:hypothetical protein [Pseudotabrizicola sp.]
MVASITQGSGSRRVAGLLALLASPAVAVFLSHNIANAGNLFYNMLFSRWLGPETFGVLATLLTLKLAILALLNALQMAVSQQVSRGHNPVLTKALAVLDRRMIVGLSVLALLLLPLAISGQLTSALGLPQGAATALAILLLAVPITAPLCIGRGIAMGRQRTGIIVASGQLEMGVRLLGGALAWVAGWGLTGVVAALVLSLVAGWLPVRRLGLAHGSRDAPTADHKAEMRFVLKLALPFATLQAAQVALMDGDVLAASVLLDQRDTGYVAVLGLLQRIQFFACFGLAAVLLPSVTAASMRGESGLREMRPIAFLFGATVLPLLGVMYLFPAKLLVIVAGPEFAGAAPALLATGLAAAAFTGSYLMATILAAWSDRRGLVLFALA